MLSLALECSCATPLLRALHCRSTGTWTNVVVSWGLHSSVAVTDVETLSARFVASASSKPGHWSQKIRKWDFGEAQRRSRSFGLGAIRDRQGVTRLANHSSSSLQDYPNTTEVSRIVSPVFTFGGRYRFDM